MDPIPITQVQNPIHNPDDARHFMTVTAAGTDRTVTINGVEVARSNNASEVREVGSRIYDPVVYFPRDDVNMSLLESTDKSTYCPLKGDTEYFDLVCDGNRIANVAWSYVTMRLGDELKSLVAFDPNQAQFT